MNETMHGSCLCGGVRFRLTQPPKNTANCHCNTCRKSTGAPLITAVVIERDALTFESGEDLLTVYPISERADKHFCKVCGTPVYNTHSGLPKHLLLHLGALDEPCHLTPAFNLFTSRMLPWVPTLAELKGFEREFER